MNYLFLALLLAGTISCKNSEGRSADKPVIETTPNSEAAIKTNCSSFSAKQLETFEWMNAPENFKVTDQGMHVEVLEGTDFFNNPEDLSVTGTAPLLYEIMAGDFIAKALVKPDFNSQWNAVSLMAYIDESNWIKFAFESSDATGPSVVTVVTKGVSDDANGVVIDDTDELWLALVKRDSIYAMHWSIDGKNYKMARLTTMPSTDEVKIGVEFQSPVGEKAVHLLKCYSLDPVRVQNLRDINPIK